MIHCVYIMYMLRNIHSMTVEMDAKFTRKRGMVMKMGMGWDGMVWYGMKERTAVYQG